MTGDRLDFGPRRHPRRMSLTPMIDVVFLLLIFFMLSSRFGMDMVLPVAGGSSGAASSWQGPPRVIDIAPDTVSLNGIRLDEAALAAALAPLMPSGDAAVVLRARDGADLQRLVRVMDRLRADGVATLILVE